MRKRIYLGISICCLLTCSNASAQEKASGTFTAEGGYGVTAPWMGDLHLTLPTAKVRIAPFVSIKGITHQSSEMLDNRTYIYSKSGNVYQSAQQLQGSGYDLKYGSTFLFPLTTSKINVKVEGERSKQKNTGTWDENVTDTHGTARSEYHWKVNMPRQDMKLFNAQADYISQNFRAAYSYQHKSQHQAMDKNAPQGHGGNNFTNYHRQTDTHQDTHNAQLQQSFHPGRGQQLTVGLGYLFSRASRDHTQQFNNELSTSLEKPKPFQHDQQTGSVFAEYRYGSPRLKATARLEYTYTHLDNDLSSKNLNDLIPQATLLWSIGKADTLSAAYRFIVRRPDMDYLDPTHLYGSHTEDYGNPALEGIHINNLSVAYNTHRGQVDLGTTVGWVSTSDGFNAVWMEKDNIRISTWGNEGVRRAFNITPSVRWRASAHTAVNAQATLTWDKRIAYAISMQNEHWGFTTEAGLHQQMPGAMSLDLTGRYSKGNTIDLYSHESHSLRAGAALRKQFLQRHTLTLAYDYQQYAKTLLTQGAYTGSVFYRPGNQHTVSLTAVFKL